jgi:hypothetical protein
MSFVPVTSGARRYSSGAAFRRGRRAGRGDGALSARQKRRSVTGEGYPSSGGANAHGGQRLAFEGPAWRQSPDAGARSEGGRARAERGAWSPAAPHRGPPHPPPARSASPPPLVNSRRNDGAAGEEKEGAPEGQAQLDAEAPRPSRSILSRPSLAWGLVPRQNFYRFPRDRNGLIPLLLGC